MNVVLVLPGSGVRLSSPTSLAGAEHLGLGSIAAYLRSLGHHVTILNFQVEESLASSEDAAVYSADRIISYDPDIIGMSITGLTIAQALRITTRIKEEKPDLHVCWGSHQASSCASDILGNESCVDTIVAGDGEIPMQHLLEVIGDGGDFSQVPGLWYRDNGSVKMTGEPPEPPLDSLRWPARDTLEYLLRRNICIKDARISTSRGCPFKCSFCVYPALGYLKRWRARKPSDIIEEIKHLATSYGITHFWFSDDNFILPNRKSRQRVEELADKLIDEDLGITYRVLMRADAADGQGKLLAKLARSGMTCVYMGIESGSPRRLKYFEKNTGPDVYRRAIKLVRDHGIGLQIGFIMFDPMTSWDDLEEDTRFLHDIQEMYLYTNYCQVLLTYPGTLFASRLVDKGLLHKGFNYKSEYRDYIYEDESIGKFADIIESANTKEQIELDDFFRRLRMIDVPGLFRGADKAIAGRINRDVEDCTLELNEKAYSMFTKLLTIARTSGNHEELSGLLHTHYEFTFNRAKELFLLFKQYPEEVIRDLSAIRGIKGCESRNFQFYENIVQGRGASLRE
ncbi:MAG: B12-binding domain-containing radical SAM protein [Deltaproteobacteria bacterium]|jgi:radical SAM superfamily enzyme YgiQ (UPF0313 family)|nr:B12-binding domain-containing radical SAM protein [Deltaproteobacteria bacterium]